MQNTTNAECIADSLTSPLARGLSSSDLCRMTVFGWAGGRSDPTTQTKQKLMRHIHVPPMSMPPPPRDDASPEGGGGGGTTQ